MTAWDFVGLIIGIIGMVVIAGMVLVIIATLVMMVRADRRGRACPNCPFVEEEK